MEITSVFKEAVKELRELPFQKKIDLGIVFASAVTLAAAHAGKLPIPNDASMAMQATMWLGTIGTSVLGAVTGMAGLNHRQPS